MGKGAWYALAMRLLVVCLDFSNQRTEEEEKGRGMANGQRKSHNSSDDLAMMMILQRLRST